jgi:hypothetical protein
MLWFSTVLLAVPALALAVPAVAAMAPHVDAGGPMVLECPGRGPGRGGPAVLGQVRNLGMQRERACWGTF